VVEPGKYEEKFQKSIFSKEKNGSIFGAIKKFRSKSIRRRRRFSRSLLSIRGCQMVRKQTKNPTLGKFWSVLQWKTMVYVMDTWSILWSFDIFYGHLV
jgi:hypothetical protein